ncbi:carbohydrate ABC transporter permease [Paenibacillus piri]|uniref:Carbohydrate ABC transporter permease n=1 Tax=Paenibacillus piri TaxID=2547395 RepID=A0A4R5KWJ3_9BACL|nr:carbohydrate ABC transporter permease [Paenibacillus piri]TDF99515.1 carbohydrate ABC transporter permease [Paenibacillus piri]
MVIFKANKLILHLLIIAGSLLMLYPLIWMISSSFKQPDRIFTDTGLLPEAATLINYIQGWRGISDTSFSVFYSNSFLVSGLSILGNILSCSLTAYAFARLEFRFKKTLFAVMLVTMMLPHHVSMIPQYIIYSKLDWINTYLPLIVPKFTAADGFFIFLIVQFIRTLPNELDKAATVDGCGPFQIYARIILPLSLPALVTTAIFTFIWTWNDFFSQLLYLSELKKYTISLGLRMFLDSSSESRWGPMFAMSALSLIPVFFIFIVFQRYLIEGIASGGLKG